MKTTRLITLLLSVIIFLLVIGIGVFVWLEIRKNKIDNPSLVLTPQPTSTATPPNGINRIFSLKGEEFQILKPIEITDIQSPLIIEGEVKGPWFFEGSFPLKLEDHAGNIIAEGHVTSNENWMSEDWVSFRGEISFDITKPTEAKLIFEKANPSNLPENEDRAEMPINLLPASSQGQTINIKIYFPNSKLDPQKNDCTKVYETVREIPATVAVAKSAIGELLKGPSELEKAQGYYTSLNPGTRLLSIQIEEGVIIADFSKGLDQNIGGSCKVSAIRSQIETTLKQFSTVKEVRICREGECQQDLILQP